jgi:hypothetical protein
MGITAKMISWRLWQALHTPFVAHPLYQQRGVWQEPTNSQAKTGWAATSIWLREHPRRAVVVSVLVAVFTAIIFGPTPLLILFFGLPFLFIFVGFPLMLIVIGTVYGIVMALLVSDTIAVEQAQGRYWLVSVTPYGRTGVTWALCSLAFNCHGSLGEIRRLLTATYIIVIACAVFLLGFILLTIALAPLSVRGDLQELPVLIAIALVLPLDFYQSVNVAGLVGMIAPTLSIGRAGIRHYVLGSFLALQVGFYLVAAFLCFGVWPHLFSPLGWLNDAGYVLLCIFTIYICREGLIVGLWLLLARRLDTSLAELDEIAGVGIKPLTMDFAGLKMRLSGLVRLPNLPEQSNR